jgi:hypothetical protein
MRHEAVHFIVPRLLARFVKPAANLNAATRQQLRERRAPCDVVLGWCRSGDDGRCPPPERVRGRALCFDSQLTSLVRR